MRIPAVALLALAAAPAVASDGAGVVAEMAERILARGHGSTCSLAMLPVASGGYYPCLDFGPYRVVKEYGRFSGYVVRDGKSPYLVMTAGERGQGFVAAGPWESDMPARIVSFWNDVVEGGQERSRKSREADADRREVEEYVRRLSESADSAGPAVPSPSSAVDAGRSVSIPSVPGAGGGVREILGGGPPVRY